MDTCKLCEPCRGSKAWEVKRLRGSLTACWPATLGGREPSDCGESKECFHVRTIVCGSLLGQHGCSATVAPSKATTDN